MRLSASSMFSTITTTTKSPTAVANGRLRVVAGLAVEPRHGVEQHDKDRGHDDGPEGDQA